MVLHDVPADIQPQPQPLLLGTVKRLKEMGQIVARDTHPAVSERDTYPLRPANASRTHPQLASFGHCFDGVEYEVQEYLLHPVGHQLKKG